MKKIIDKIKGIRLRYRLGKFIVDNFLYMEEFKANILKDEKEFGFIRKSKKDFSNELIDLPPQDEIIKGDLHTFDWFDIKSNIWGEFSILITDKEKDSF